MVKVWIHKPGSTEPFLAEEITLQDCVTQLDLEQARFLQPLGDRPPSAAEPGPLGANPDAELVVFEVLADEPGGQIKPGYYASQMTADTVLELIGGE
jgi:hypothetical protein